MRTSIIRFLIGASIILISALSANGQDQTLTADEVQAMMERPLGDEPPFVPGEIVVKTADGNPIDPDRMSAMGLNRESVTGSGEHFIYSIVEPIGTMSAEAAMDRTRAVCDSLDALPEFEYAQLNYLYQYVSHPAISVAGLTESMAPEMKPPARIAPPGTAPNDPLYAQQWHYWNNGSGAGESLGGINLPDAWDTTTGDRSVVVAVLDTGILPGEPDANAANLVAGYDFISSAFTGNDGDGRDADPTDPGDAIFPNECGNTQRIPDSWHGTHVAGTIGYGTTNNGDGIAGVNWEVSVQPVRVLGKCGGTVADIADAIRWSAGLPVPGVPDNTTPADIINMSLGGGGACSGAPAFQSAIDDAVAAGSTVVVAAGNSATDAANFSPASCDGVVTVAASDGRGRLVTRYSNYGATVEILAPGGDVRRDDNGDGEDDGVLSITGRGYELYNGTSMAAPHVAGAMALWLAEDPSQGPTELLNRAQSFALPRSSTDCPDPCGAGLLNANAFSATTPAVISLVLDPDEAIGNGGQTQAIATVTRNGVPVAGVPVTFAMADVGKARILTAPPVQQTNGDGEARVTLEGVDNSGSTTLKATAEGSTASVTVKVPSMGVIGLILLLIMMVGFELFRRRRAVA